MYIDKGHTLRGHGRISTVLCSTYKPDRCNNARNVYMIRTKYTDKSTTRVILYQGIHKGLYLIKYNFHCTFVFRVKEN